LGCPSFLKGAEEEFPLELLSMPGVEAGITAGERLSGLDAVSERLFVFCLKKVLNRMLFLTRRSTLEK